MTLAASGTRTEHLKAIEIQLKRTTFIFAGSVFDLIPNKDKEKMEAVKKIPGAKPAGSSSYVSADTSGSYTADPQPASIQKSTPEQSNVQQQQQQHHQQQEQRSSEAPLFRGGTSGFKPFASNPEKQKRYERYLEIRKQGKKCKSCSR